MIFENPPLNIDMQELHLQIDCISSVYFYYDAEYSLVLHF